MAGYLLTAADELVDELVAAGVRATTDPRNTSPPCALVTPEAAAGAGRCAYDVELTVVLIAPGPTNLDALRVLDGLHLLLDGVADAAGAPGRLVAYESPTTGETLAGWEVTLTRTIARPIGGPP